MEKARTEGLLQSSTQRLHELQAQLAELQAQVMGGCATGADMVRY